VVSRSVLIDRSGWMVLGRPVRTATIIITVDLILILIILITRILLTVI
jgi:hypothetical protein